MSDKKITSAKQTIKNYEILGLLGKGGMGEVYLAKHPTLKREIVLKRLKIKDKEASDRFLQEAKVMLEFRNENIVQFYDHFKEGASTYIAMEYVKGKALNKIIEENGSIPVPIALFILYQVALGLFHAHQKKVIHRDIKPHNILISKDGEVKLTDFGIAMRTTDDEDITKTGSVVGTPAYMSPEQFSSKKEVTYQSDIYSLGVVFYEMLTGSRPFKNEYSTEVLDAIVRGKFVPPQKYVHNMPLVAKNILSRTLTPKQKNRYKDLSVLIKSLRKYFKKFNIFEIRDSLKKIVLNDKNLKNSQFMIMYENKRKFVLYKLLFGLFFIFIVSFGFAFYYTNSYYEVLLPNIYGKVKVEFNKANMSENNIFLGIDDKYEKAVVDVKGNFSKFYYLPYGEHTFTVVSGSYKNTKKMMIYSIANQKEYNIQNQNVFIPVFKLSPKEVIVYFRFWNVLKPNELLFQFDYHSDDNIEEYLDENSNLKILSSAGYIPVKEYIYNSKQKSKTFIPFYSSKKYSLNVEKPKMKDILYDDKQFDIEFALDDRTVVVHIPLVPTPATVNWESNVKNIPIIINGKDRGLVYEKGGYIYKKYSGIQYVKENNIYKGSLNIPAGSYDIKILKNGKSINYKLNSGRLITVKVKKENGKYSY